MVALACKPLDPFGAEVDFDLLTPFTSEIKTALRRAFADYRLLLFRGQSLTRAQQEALVGLFGPLAPPERDIPLVSNRGNEYALGDTEITFHCELSYAPEPYIALSLHALDVEDAPTSTKFVDGARAWQSLSDGLKARVTELKVRNIFAPDVSRRDPRRALDPRLPQAIHPMVRTHPVSGKTFLFVSHLESMEVVGLDRESGEALLAEVFAQCYRPANILEHYWRNSDLIVWDNLAMQHGRGAVGKATRTLQRVCSITRTFPEQFPQFRNGHVEGSNIVLEDASG